MTLRHVLDVYRGYTVPTFRIIEHKRRWFTFSGILLALSVVGLVFIQMEFSIDFEGGTKISYPLRTDATVEEIRATIVAAGFEDAEVQIVTDQDGRTVQIRTQALPTVDASATPTPSVSSTPSGSADPSASPSGGPSPSIVPSTQDEPAAGSVEALRADLAEQAGVGVDEINVEDIGPTWGSKISRQALVSLLIALAAIAAYISLRFEWSMAVGAMVALVHDVVITGGIYALTRREVTPETIIAILTILGFSLYDTVVIYDKVKENTESPAMVARLGYDGVVDVSLNHTIMRSVNTSLVVLVPILSLLLFGGETLKDFAFAMFVGVAIGAYSSIFIAAPILTLLHGRRAVSATQGRPRPVGATAPTAGNAAAEDAAATAATARVGAGPQRPPRKNKRRPPPKRKRR